jgi:Bacterial Ig-like domain
MNTKRIHLSVWPFLVAALLAAQAGQGAPQIASSEPARGAKDVDPGLKEITVTFDQDMDGGMSWTGGGPQFPKIPEGKKGYWRDKRTCVLPVKLQPGHSYRVGINSQSYRNFRSTAGVPAMTASIWFSTSGTAAPSDTGSQPPRIVSMSPANGATEVSPSVKELRVTFNVAMGEGCSWTGSGPQFPTIPEGKKPSWTEDHKSCVLPVELKPNSQYRLGLNSQSFHNFQSADGVPLVPVVYTFKTSGQ